MNTRMYTAILAATALVASCKNPMTITPLPYPVARMDSTVDDYHGTRVADPYRWMEDDQSAETAAWVAEENAVTADYLGRIPYRDAVRERLTELWNYPKYGVPSEVGPYLFYFMNDGLQNQSVLYRQTGTDGAPEPFLDPNTLSDDGTVALSSIAFSPDDRYMAYVTAASGSDWNEIRVREVATGRDLPDLVRWVKFSGASWGDGGFYYSRYDAPAPGSELSAQNRFQKVYFHRLGTEQSADRLIYEDREHPLRYFNAEQSRDGRWLFVWGSEGTHGAEILYKDLTQPGADFRTLFPGFANDYSIVDCRDNRLLVLTNQEAPNYRLVEVDLTAPRPAPRDVIAEDSGVLLQNVTPAGDYLMATYLENASSKVYQYTAAGERVREVALAELGTVAGFDADPGRTATYYALSGFTAPPVVYRYDLQGGESSLFRRSEVAYDPSCYTTEQTFFTSKDGTQVPMFLVHRKDMKLDGQNPVYLYGYGGFNISLTPGFSPAYIMFMEQGGVYAMVNLRGGGEFGERWHRAGMLDRKQNVFDDFIAAAEYLVAEGYTSPSKLAIAGGSNGGLLVGACMTQRPDLYAVALPAVGVMDMLRYHRFTIGWGWSVEYGNSDDPAQFAYIYRYSPLHNIRKGTCYPATLITTADHDDRVVPAHSFKFAATLQAAQGCDRPTLIRIDTKAGHGAGKPTSKKIDEVTDQFSFLFWNTGTKVRFDR